MSMAVYWRVARSLSLPSEVLIKLWVAVTSVFRRLAVDLLSLLLLLLLPPAPSPSLFDFDVLDMASWRLGVVFSGGLGRARMQRGTICRYNGSVQGCRGRGFGPVEGFEMRGQLKLVQFFFDLPNEH